MYRLLTQPNLHPQVLTLEKHLVPLMPCCPVSLNPDFGSVLEIAYIPQARFLEVYSLKKYLLRFIGGRKDVRDMEGMIQIIASECAQALDVLVRARAWLIIDTGQPMFIECWAAPCTVE
jgi:NADPH-dependent 7-cyano-7-deazaguanine reductase QueF